MGNDLVPVDIPTDLPSIEQEIGGIQALMRTDRTAYNRDEGKQARLRALYTARGDTQPMISQESAQGMDLMEPIPRDEFLKTNPSGDYGYYLGLLREAGDITVAVPGKERGAFIKGVEALPPSVISPMFWELANKNSVTPDWITPEQVQRASSGYPGASIVREWGHEAGQKIGKVRARLWRLGDMLSDTDWETFLRWLSGLTEGQAKAVYRKLAA